MAFDLNDRENKATRDSNGANKIKVGEYVRTDDGYIGKLVEYIPNAINYLKIDVKREIKRIDGMSDNFIYTRYGFQLKHSKNIIDLLEEGDYVNGKKIDAILDGFLKPDGVGERVLCFETDFPVEKGLRAYHNCDIKSIVTKEQFNSIAYRLEE